MPNEASKRPWPVDLIDELLRIEGRFKSAFADFRRAIGLNESELMLLNALCEAEASATVSQVARSLGHARQLIQRSANSLIGMGLIETLPNPDHKRAVLLRPTRHGWDVKRQVNARAEVLADALRGHVDVDAVYSAINSLRAVRRALENHQRPSRNDTALPPEAHAGAGVSDRPVQSETTRRVLGRTTP